MEYIHKCNGMLTQLYIVMCVDGWHQSAIKWVELMLERHLLQRLGLAKVSLGEGQLVTWSSVTSVVSSVTTVTTVWYSTLLQ